MKKYSFKLNHLKYIKLSIKVKEFSFDIHTIYFFVIFPTFNFHKSKEITQKSV